MDDLELFTVEADGRPIAVLAHASLVEAEEEAHRVHRRGDYAALGATTQRAVLSVRPARDDERGHWHDAVREAREEGEPYDVASLTVFLVPVPDQDDKRT